MWTILDIYYIIIRVWSLDTLGGGILLGRGCLKFFNMLNVCIALVQNFEDINEDIFSPTAICNSYLWNPNLLTTAGDC